MKSLFINYLPFTQNLNIKTQHQFSFVSIIVISFLAIFSFIFLADRDLFIHVTDEDGIFESIGALCFLLSGIIFFRLYYKSKNGNVLLEKKNKRNVFYLLLGIAFLLCFFEEISWGQRIFNIATPEALQEVNMQNEINIHNLSIFYPDEDANGNKNWIDLDFLFRMFWISFCFLIPLFVLLSDGFGKFMKKINMPIVPIFFGIFLLGNFFLIKIIGRIFPSETSEWYHGIIETREMIIAFIFFLIAIWFYQNLKNEDLENQQIQGV